MSNNSWGFVKTSPQQISVGDDIPICSQKLTDLQLGHLPNPVHVFFCQQPYAKHCKTLPTWIDGWNPTVYRIKLCDWKVIGRSPSPPEGSVLPPWRWQSSRPGALALAMEAFSKMVLL